MINHFIVLIFIYIFQIGFEDLNHDSQQHLLDLVAVYRTLIDVQQDQLNSDHVDNNTDNLRDNMTLTGDNNDSNTSVKIQPLNSYDEKKSGFSSYQQEIIAPVQNKPVAVIQPLPVELTPMEAKENDQMVVITSHLPPPPSRTPSPVTPTCAPGSPQRTCRTNLPDLLIDIPDPRLPGTSSSAPNLPDLVPQQQQHTTPTTKQQRRGSFRIVASDCKKELINQTPKKESIPNESYGYHTKTKRSKTKSDVKQQVVKLQSHDTTVTARRRLLLDIEIEHHGRRRFGHAQFFQKYGHHRDHQRPEKRNEGSKL